MTYYPAPYGITNFDRQGDQVVKRISRIVAGVLLSVSGVVWAGEFDAAAPEQSYCVECWLVGSDTDGNELVITAPKVSLFENQKGSVRDVSRSPRPGKTETPEWLEEGTTIDVKIFRADDGRRFLDAELKCTGHAAETQESKFNISLLTRHVPGWIWQPKPEKALGIRLVSTTVRVIGPVKLGEKIVVPLAAPGFLRQRDVGGIERTKHRIEMRVTEIGPENQSHASSAKPRLILGGVTPRVISQEEEENKLGLDVAP
jgi:hypothetical protein